MRFTPQGPLSRNCSRRRKLLFQVYPVLDTLAVKNEEEDQKKGGDRETRTLAARLTIASNAGQDALRYCHQIMESEDMEMGFNAANETFVNMTSRESSTPPRL